MTIGIEWVIGLVLSVIMGVSGWNTKINYETRRMVSEINGNVKTLNQWKTDHIHTDSLEHGHFQRQLDEVKDDIKNFKKEGT